jgi:hypothetical protein
MLCITSCTSAYTQSNSLLTAASAAATRENEGISAARRWMSGDRRQPQTKDNSLKTLQFYEKERY